MQHVQQTDGVRLSGVRTDVQRALAVLHVVVGVGHGTITPSIGNTRNRGRVANARLVVAVVTTPKADPFAQQISLLIVMFGRADNINRIRAAGFTQVQHFCRNFGQGRIPADALVLAVDQFHRVAQAELAVAVLAQRGTFGAMCTEVNRRVKNRFLPHPNAVLDYSIDRAAD